MKSVPSWTCASRLCFFLLCVPVTSPSAQERCSDIPVDVVAISVEERRLACAAATHALQLLGRCNISLRRPLKVEISSEVRHPFGRPMFGLFDLKQEESLSLGKRTSPRW